MAGQGFKKVWAMWAPERSLVGCGQENVAGAFPSSGVSGCGVDCSSISPLDFALHLLFDPREGFEVVQI